MNNKDLEDLKEAIDKLKCEICEMCSEMKELKTTVDKLVGFTVKFPPQTPTPYGICGTCPECDGTGKIVMTQRYDPDSTAKLSGITVMYAPCQRCKGTGVVWNS